MVNNQPNTREDNSSNKKNEHKLQSLHSISQGSLISLTNSNPIQENYQCTLSTKEDLKQSTKEPVSNGKMSRMEWIFHLKQIFDEIKKKSRPNQTITGSLIIEYIHTHISVNKNISYRVDNLFI